MTRLEALRKSVEDLYQAKDPKRDEWADWFYKNHIFVVSNNCKEIAERFGIDSDLSQAAGMLHDIADVQTDRIDPNHYRFATKKITKKQSETEARQWALDKIERDYSNKIFFKEVKQEVSQAYEGLKQEFSR